MQKIVFDILVQTASIVGLFWTILKLTPKSTLLSFTILYSEPYLDRGDCFMNPSNSLWKPMGFIVGRFFFVNAILIRLSTFNPIWTEGRAS